MNYLDHLVHEHEFILKMTEIVDRIGQQTIQNQNLPVEDLKKAIEFIRIYADQLHHSKEEKLLFKQMEEHLGPLAQKMIRHGMLGEHEIARYHVGAWNDALIAYEQTPNLKDLHTVLIHMGAWADLLRRHAEKENAAVYPFAARNLAPEVQENLEQDSAQLEENQKDLRDQMLQIFVSLHDKYPPEEN